MKDSAQMNDLVIGIDTSNYTTSLAIMTLSGELVANLKAPLAVSEGQRGLRQSDALFLHTKNLPSLMEDAEKITRGKRIVAVGVSEKPRDVAGSYMPCFLAGVAAAKSVAMASGAEYYPFSHQAGHIMAGIFSSGRRDFLDGEFAAFHVSGGTTELLRVKPLGNSFSCELIGGTKDLNAGQLVDRLGVYMGLEFPSGRELERLALKNEKPLPRIKLKPAPFVNLSGAENKAKALFEESLDKCLTSAFVLDYITKSLSAMAEDYLGKYSGSRFLFVGGVMSNSIIRRELEGRFNAAFAEPDFSRDNAVGIAALAQRSHLAKSIDK